MRAFRIGRAFAIELRVDWSWVFIFVLLTWSLVAALLNWHPDWSRLQALAIAVAASVLFFGGILLHELARAVVATRYGLRVRSITLFLFGGVSNLAHEPPTARAEFLIAIVGPITSIALGVVLLLVASLVTGVPMKNVEGSWRVIAQLGPLSILLVWLGPINVICGLFNLVPGLPLDGGRAFRSMLWSLTGDLRAATRWACATGQAVGWLFIVGGIALTFGAHVRFFDNGLVSGLWLAFIGWFLRGAAAQAETRLALDDALAGMTVEQLMRRDGPVATQGISVAQLVQQHFIRGGERALPVIDGGALLGLVSIADVRTLEPELWAATPVGAIMRGVEALSVAAPDEPLAEAFERLARQDIEQLPVVVKGTPVGMLRRRDVTRWIELLWRTRLSAVGSDSAHGGWGRVNQRPRTHGEPSMTAEGSHHAV